MSAQPGGTGAIVLILYNRPNLY